MLRMRPSTSLQRKGRENCSKDNIMCITACLQAIPLSSLLKISFALHHNTRHSDGQSIYVVPKGGNTPNVASICSTTSSSFI